jgi:hypothetical protein
MRYLHTPMIDLLRFKLLMIAFRTVDILASAAMFVFLGKLDVHFDILSVQS